MDFLTEVNRCIQNLGITDGTGVLVALSGGADSMALLYALNQLRQPNGLRIVAAHVHHGLRGEEADRDADFVVNQCASLQIPCETLFCNVAEQRLAGEGIEQAGRRIRYAFFEKVRLQYDLQYIATAHHADDNLETVLLHLTRGSGLHGLCGIPLKSGVCIRPLLTVTRADIEQFCEDKHIPFVVDSTNVDIVYSRNRIRNEVIPHLKTINPQVTDACTRMTAQLREEDAFLENLVDTWLEKAREEQKYLRDVLLDMPPVLLKRALKRVMEQVGGDPEEKHILLLSDALRDGGAVQIPGDVRMVVDTKYVFADTVLPQTISFDKPLVVGDTIEIGDTVYTAQCVTVAEYEEKQKVHKNVLKFACDYDKIVGSMRIRSREAGDRFHTVGGVGKSLKKFFNEQAVPPHVRANVPIVCDEQGIILLTGFSCDERVKLDKHTKRIFILLGGEKGENT